MQAYAISLITILLCQVGWAAAPLTHAYLAHYWPSGDPEAFLVGTLFPDIRYLGVIEREETHFTQVSISDVAEESDPFTAGMLFHSYVDLVREEHMIESGIYAHLPNHPMLAQAMKFAEDKILFSTYWSIGSMTSQMMEHVRDEEAAFGIARTALIQWHLFHQVYLSIGPSDMLLSEIVAGMGGDEDVILLANDLANDPKFQIIFFGYLRKILDRINQHPVMCFR